MPTLGTATETNQAQSDILDLVDSLIPLLPQMANIIEAWVNALTPAATTLTVITALQGPLTAHPVIFDRYKDFLRTRFNINLDTTPLNTLTDAQRRLVLNAADAYMGILLNLSLFAKMRADAAE
jgi:hypothetical protein